MESETITLTEEVQQVKTKEKNQEKKNQIKPNNINSANSSIFDCS